MSENNSKQAVQPTEKNVKIVPIVQEMQTSYLDYAMSVIISRALPDIRDGLKPVHRRILFGMKVGGYEHNKPFKKSAKTVGEVMGSYHPHGDAAIYHTLVRMAQDFSMRVPLVEGQGNFGSMDGDSPAAMRYTESRLQKVSTALLDDLDKDTVNWQPNYDESIQEPQYLPAKFPNLLVNGGTGIAVGMATNIPTHNLGEVLDACLAFTEDPSLTSEDLMKYVPAPDFPTGGIILGRKGSHGALTQGRGSVIIRARTHFEEVRGRNAIIITEIPYSVNKKTMIEKIADLVKEKRIEGISDIRDESDRHGVRVVIELKREAIPEIVLNVLFKYSPLQTSFGVNMLAINKGRPARVNLQDIIREFIDFREDVIRRRTVYELNKARNKAHTLAGLVTAVANLDEVIKIIRGSKTPEIAKQTLMSKNWPAGDIEPFIKLIDDPKSQVIDNHYILSEEQAKAILELRLHKLTGLEREKLQDEITQIAAFIKEQLRILQNREVLYDIMKNEFIEVKEKFATPRKTEIVESEFESDIEDLIAKEDMIITITNTGYVKRVSLDTYRAQRRGGKGRNAMTTKEEDFVNEVFVANTHTPLILFSNKGMAYKLKVYRLPLGSPTSKGKAFINILPLQQDETITTVMPIPEDANWDEMSIVFATTKGTVRRNNLSAFESVRANGKIAMKFDDESDELVGVVACDEDKDIMLSLQNGKCIRFPVKELRVFNSRNSMGVKGVKLSSDDKVISMAVINGTDADSDLKNAYLKKSKALRGLDDLEGEEAIETNVEIDDTKFTEMAEKEDFLLTITDTGFGKRTSSYEYRTTHRGGSGIANIKLGAKSNSVVASFPIVDGQEIILITDQGKLIRIPMTNIRIAGRQTMGVTLFKVADGEKIISSAVVDADTDEEENDENSSDNTEINENVKNSTEEKTEE